MRGNKTVFYIVVILLISSCGIFKKKPSSTSGEKKRETTVKKTSILDKYTQILGEDVNNEKLYQFIDVWLGVPYKYGGKTKSGVDCSNFACTLLREAYQYPTNFYFPSAKLAEQGKKIELSQAKEGDLVFFTMNKGSKISHVGVYLANNKFVHASTSKGVIVSSLKEDYYKQRFFVCVRL